MKDGHTRRFFLEKANNLDKSPGFGRHINYVYISEFTLWERGRVRQSLVCIC